MAILGIDFGKKKIGLSISEGILASPYQTLQFKSFEDLREKLLVIVEKEDVHSLVVGVPEQDRIGAKKFGEKLSRTLKIPVNFIDETLTTFEAQKFKIKKGSDKEDQIAASLILQSFLEELNKNG